MKRIITVCTIILCGFLLSAQSVLLPYQNPNLPVEQRVADLLSRMTLEEKVAQMNMKSLNELKLDDKGKVSEADLKEFFGEYGIGFVESPFIEHGKIAQISQAADKYIREHTRLGIPAVQIAECLHGHLSLGTTIFPQSIGLGSTWNPSLIYKMAEVIATEASLAGVDQALSPLFDLARDPRYGRVEECYGEDPFLVKEMGVAFVKGLQGEPEATRKGLAPGKIAAMGKHFVAYSVPESGINIAPALVGERNLRELHLYPFEGAVKEANIYAIMPGYHEVDGVPMHSNRWLLDDILRKEWNFEGYLFSDYGSVSMLTGFHKVAEDLDDACVQAVNAGVDVEAPHCDAYKNLATLVREGRVPESEVDAAVTRILTAKFRMGLFDRPFFVNKKDASRVHTSESIALSQQIAEESIVLLKNENALLPLDKNGISSIAVIGPNADKVQFGDYSITKNNEYGVTVLEGIRNNAGKNVKVNYALGCGITSLSTDGIAEAVEVARNSDVVVLVLGGTSMPLSGIGWGDQNSKEPNTCGEGFDRNELDFPGIQPLLFDKIVETGKPVVLIMINGRPLTIGAEAAKVGALLEAWYPGEKGGEAVARILFGDVNPSGRLSVTFPPTTGHIPMYANYKPSGRGFYHQPGTPGKSGRDYVFAAPKPLFCFGYGLSYTTFEYSDLKIENNLGQEGKGIDVYCAVTNTGSRDGAEVVQLYVRDVCSSVTTPIRALKAFEKVYLKKGETKVVHLCIAEDDLKLWDRDMQFVLEPGEFEVYVGSSAEDTRLKGKFEL
ncbi:MAG: glycoside hydrolase family 3 C-terminal domain-containing protein [Bacteroidales bacterium]|nr:glycoside hydrolase family 3 C-terminal domain-containing protein [Bacteroidales bacterium]